MRWSLLRHHPSEETERRRFPSKSSFAFCRWSRSLPRGFDRRQLERRPRRDDRWRHFQRNRISRSNRRLANCRLKRNVFKVNLLTFFLLKSADTKSNRKQPKNQLCIMVNLTQPNNEIELKKGYDQKSWKYLLPVWKACMKTWFSLGSMMLHEWWVI